MDKTQTYLTVEGKAKLQTDLADLKLKLREIADRIDKAKELGDLSENAEYHEAKEDYAFTQGKIQQIEYDLTHGVVISHNKQSTIVDVGATIVVKRENGKTSKYTIVGSNEASPAQGLISNESPIGQAFLGRKKGDVVEVKTPTGGVKYTIEEIQ
ncbi:MAG: Transcription elongation factor GreA [Candidatus Magasanikbacteria bacterium GW2011_GWA2_45_39]|uniref:Transcription elongation factor GreA n=2 Tax=Candidatus Magasanikiibacteriota TaxID=1752731 RepID=A0A0G1MYN8_9BACT|nr:MAG: Transcription elongation factor GreA [Candidatus Magasanikbacteria bacterium GW2011_GWA2_45_39]KKU13496.1 MAG: Transcription elongation factor GreA [Candidatus Magasanikbacteria bacterium GW2011_GWC2_45_8]HBW73915.1 transcription elongation factor GreA [Candidatus Magasanikbacteria bacterium]